MLATTRVSIVLSYSLSFKDNDSYVQRYNFACLSVTSEPWSLTVRKNHIHVVGEQDAEEVYGPKKDEVKGGGTQHN
jgi:hypothetical protein